MALGYAVPRALPQKKPLGPASTNRLALVKVWLVVKQLPVLVCAAAISFACGRPADRTVADAPAPSAGAPAVAADESDERTRDDTKSATILRGGAIARGTSLALPAAGGPASNGVFGAWTALGSGCRASSEVPGDVLRFEGDDAARGAPFVGQPVRARFEFAALILDGRGADGGNLSRECALRLHVNPPPNFRIARVAVEGDVVFEKYRGAVLEVRTALKLGPVVLGERNWAFGTEERLDRQTSPFRIDRTLDLDAGSLAPMPACGERKVLGIDAGWFAARSGPAAASAKKEMSAGSSPPDEADAQHALHVEFGQGRSLSVTVSLGPCG